MRTEKKSKYDGNYCRFLDKDNEIDNNNNNEYCDVDNANNNDNNPSSLPPTAYSPPQVHRMPMNNVNVFETESDRSSLLERTEGLIHFCIDEGWKLEELKLLLKNLELQPEEKHDLMVIATTSMKLVQQCINDDVVQNEIMTTETPEETPTATTVTEAEAEVEAVVEAITITPPAPPVLSRYTRKTGNLIPYNKKAFEVKKKWHYSI